jgi:leucyl-tRNA---protein transferase
MFVLPHDRNSSLPLFLSKPHACPYLPDVIERKLFTRLSGDPEKDRETNSVLTQAGFRRSHDVVYRPACPSCFACVPVRIPVETFRLSPSLRRIAARNRGFGLNDIGATLTCEHYNLFRRYQLGRHPESDMVQMTQDELIAMVEEGVTDTCVYELRGAMGSKTDGKLWGGILVDRVEDGLSAVYSYFQTDEPRRSLGIFLILEIIREAKRLSLPYVYLGYWIAGARKMAYKARFTPLEAFGPRGWSVLGSF